MIEEELLRFDYCKIKHINFNGIICILETTYDNIKELSNDLDILKTNTGCIPTVKITSRPSLKKDGQIVFNPDTKVIVNVYSEGSLSANIYKAKNSDDINLFIL